MIQSCFQAGSRLIHLRPPIDVEDEQYAVEAILDHHNVGRFRYGGFLGQGDIDAEMGRVYWRRKGVTIRWHIKWRQKPKDVTKSETET